jgi:hypothetical protein
MPKALPANLLALVCDQLTDFPQGAQIDDLAERLGSHLSRRSLQRRLAEWAQKGEVRAEGIGKARRYFLAIPAGRFVTAAPQEVAHQGGSFVHPPFAQLDWPNPIQRVEQRSGGFLQSGVQEPYVPLSSAGREVLGRVRQPIVDRPPVGYRRGFVDRYKPNATAYLPKPVASHLLAIGRAQDGERPAGTFARTILDRLLIDLSWASSRLEGNTYSLLETERLIRAGDAATGKDAKETQMILNHKSAIELLVNDAEEIGVNRYTVCNLHAMLAENLLDDPDEGGRLRHQPVAVAGTTYLPTAIPQLIEEMFELVLVKARAIRNPFEQAFFLMVQMPYLQPFVDVNKRTSRLAANIPLIKRNLVPLSFIDVPSNAYTEGLSGVYERNRIELIRDVFVWAYERSCQRYATVRDSLPQPDPFRLKYRTALSDVVRTIVTGLRAPTAHQVGKESRKSVPAVDLAPFTKLALGELERLHEGNIARFGLRPSEFRVWTEARNVQSKGKAKKRS